MKGIVIWFGQKKEGCARAGYGFIKPDDGSKDVFVHWQDVDMEGFKVLHKDDKVSFEYGVNSKGEPKAIKVKAL